MKQFSQIGYRLATKSTSIPKVPWQENQNDANKTVNLLVLPYGGSKVDKLIK